MYDIDTGFNNNVPFAVVNDVTLGLVELSPSFTSSVDLSITYYVAILSSYAPDYNSDFPNHIVSKIFEITVMNPCD